MARTQHIETCFNYCNKELGFFSSDEKKWINHIRKLAKKFPDKVQILKQPEDNDGCIYARVHPSGLRVTFVNATHKPMTEERKQQQLEALQKAREKKELEKAAQA